MCIIYIQREKTGRSRPIFRERARNTPYTASRRPYTLSSRRAAPVIGPDFFAQGERERTTGEKVPEGQLVSHSREMDFSDAYIYIYIYLPTARAAAIRLAREPSELRIMTFREM